MIDEKMNDEDEDDDVVASELISVVMGDREFVQQLVAMITPIFPFQLEGEANLKYVDIYTCLYVSIHEGKQKNWVRRVFLLLIRYL